MTYSGDKNPLEAWEQLQDDPRAVLVDVRTQAEWTFVGVPDLRSLGKAVVLIEWQIYPGMPLNAEFVPMLTGELRRRGVQAEDPLYFLCRTGGRSRAAAEAMTGSGFLQCYNVAEGFEGDSDRQQHRGQVNGWKARGLPWVQN